MFSKSKKQESQIAADTVLKTFADFEVPMELVEVIKGHFATTLHVRTKKPTRMAEIDSFKRDLSYALGVASVEIQAPIPNTKLIGIRIPVTNPPMVTQKSVMQSPEYLEAKGELIFPFGISDAGGSAAVDLFTLPHLLIGGMTGSGKSTFLHNILTSLMKRYSPEEVRFILIDPKRVEFSIYNDCPHLLTPSIGDAKNAVLAFKWACKEMERRYEVLQARGVQDIQEYHALISAKKRSTGKENVSMEKMPYVVMVIDELADLMFAYPKETEAVFIRLAQMSRAVGIHLLVSTVFASVKVVTGVMKANIPSRIAFKTSSLIDSRGILDSSGAEKLCGQGDALYMTGEMVRPERLQTPRLSYDDVKRAVKEIQKQYFGMYPLHYVELSDPYEEEDEIDELFDEVRDLVIAEKKASTSLIQRRFKLGYGRSARLMDQLEIHHVIAPSDGTNNPRVVLPQKSA